MFIQTESTPNPATLKFIPGQPVVANGTHDFTDQDDTASSPLATRLFRINGVVRVFFGHDFISVTKSEEVDWMHVKPPVLGAIMEHYQAGLPIIEESISGESNPSSEHSPDDPISKQIRELIDTRVRPAVAQDGGDIVFHGFDRGVVYLHMQGACAGCPSSTITLKMGIENLLRHYVPEVVEVRPVAP